MWPGCRPLLSLLLAASGATVAAAPVTLAFSGAVTSDGFGLLPPGAAIHGSFTFDPAAADSNVLSIVEGSFVSTGPAFGFVVDVGGLVFAVPQTLTVNTMNDGGADQYGVLAESTSPAAPLSLSLLLTDLSQTALASDALPTGAPLLAAFAIREFKLLADDADFLGSIDALRCVAGCDVGTPVPEPGSLLLTATALSALLAGAVRRGQRRSRG